MAAPVPKEADASKASKASNSNENITVRPDSPLSNGINPTPSKVSTTSMVGLARIITRETEKLETYLNESRIPMPGFDVDAPANFPKLPNEMKKAREEIVRANQLLTDLVTGPMEHLRWMAWDPKAQSFLPGSTATFAHIASKIGLDEPNTRRLLRHAMTNHIFSEPFPGIVAHTAASRLLAENCALSSWVGLNVEDIWPPAVKVISALKAYPDANEPTQTGFCVANGTVDKEPMFVTLGKDVERAKRMAEGMVSLTGGEGYEVSYLFDSYPWEELDARAGTVVDVGGSHGFVCVDLAKRYPNLKFVVQDLPKTIASAPKLEGKLKDRIIFQAHDFHTRQPVEGADIYLFRWIFHNQSDKYTLNMLRQLIPALKKGARVVINDHCLPEPGTESAWDEKIIRSMDLVMLTLLNAKEREVGEFEKLFREASEEFRFLGVTRPEGCRMSTVVAEWVAEDFGGVFEGQG